METEAYGGFMAAELYKGRQLIDAAIANEKKGGV